MQDKFKDECGVFGIFNHEDAARLTYLGLYALQHRGQESAGMVSSDGTRLHAYRGMGYVSEIFRQEELSHLPGRSCIGHVRYSTAGSVSLREAQPFLVDGYRGQLALCHNGNLPYANEVREELELDGAIFSSTSDTEVVLHKIARSRAVDLVGAITDTFTEIEGAYSMLRTGFIRRSRCRSSSLLTASSNTFTSLDRTRSCSAARLTRAVTRWVNSSRASARQTLTSLCRFPTPESPRLSATRRNRA